MNIVDDDKSGDTLYGPHAVCSAVSCGTLYNLVSLRGRLDARSQRMFSVVNFIYVNSIGPVDRLVQFFVAVTAGCQLARSAFSTYPLDSTVAKHIRAVSVN